MAYFYQQNINGIQVPMTVHKNDKDKGINIFIFLYDDSKYIGTVVCYMDTMDYKVIDDYSIDLGIKDFDFYEEVDYFFDIVYGLDR